MSRTSVSLFIFRRDLRIHDNTALGICCLKSKHPVLPIFIFNKVQIDPSENNFYSNNAVQFMIECLKDLARNLPQLQFFHVEKHDTEALRDIAEHVDIQEIFTNTDFTPFARKRDQRISKWCSRRGVNFVGCTSEYSLVDPPSMQKPYQVFTPFYKKYKDTQPIPPRPRKAVIPIASFYSKNILPGAFDARSLFNRYLAEGKNTALIVRGGRARALTIIDACKKGDFDTYERDRDLPSLVDGTTKLSAYLKNGCVSLREVYWAAKDSDNEALVRELYWRAFYDQLTWWFPDTLRAQIDQTKSNSSLRAAYNDIPWHRAKDKPTDFDKWARGMTGFPFVDAGMRQLAKTGWMHNRLRMVVASFLVKDLWIDWRDGERHFARSLVDVYHPANNGGWQWSSGGGADAQQYSRVFNPWLQSAKFDPDAEFIKTWIPELRSVPARDIHKGTFRVPNYPRPMVDHAVRAKNAISQYKVSLAK